MLHTFSQVFPFLVLAVKNDKGAFENGAENDGLRTLRQSQVGEMLKPPRKRLLGLHNAYHIQT